MATVRGYTADEVDLLVDEFEKLVTASLDRVVARVAADLTGPIVGASSAGLGPADVANVTVLWQDEVDGVLTPYIGSVYQGSATSVGVHLVDAFPDDLLPGVPLVADDFALDYMKGASNRLVGVGDELWEDCRNELVDGIKQGQSIEQIAGRINNVSNFSHTRAQRIARTEVHSASEAGNIGQLKAVGYENDEVTKQWEATLDLRTRDTHTAENGKSVQLDQKFVLISGHQLDYPGDPYGAAGEVINCRCTTLFDIDTAPKERCAGAFVAAATSGSCIVPTPKADISGVPINHRISIFNKFMESKISPAWGGAKIYKVLQQVRKDLPSETAGLDDWQLLAAVDQYYVAKKDTFSLKFNEWFQSPAGKKVVGNMPGPVTHAKMPASASPIQLNVPPPPNPAQQVLTLPPIAPKPNPSDLVFTGKKMGGATGAQVWRDQVTGQRWLLKTTDPMGGIYSNKYLFEVENFAARVQSKALQTRPAIYVMDVHGKKSIIQSMFDGQDAWPKASAFDPLKLSAADIHAMQQEQIFDWMISNFDTHTGQWLRLSNGQLLGIDKGQAFKFFGKDKLSWDYVPVTPLSPNGLTYTKLWQAYVQGKNVDLQDPTIGALGEYIDRLVAIPDADYKSLLSGYAKLRFDNDVDRAKFLQAAVNRKNALKADFADFWARAQKERALSLGQAAPKVAVKTAPMPTGPYTGIGPPPPPPAVAATTVAPTVGDIGDITQLTFAQKSGIKVQWVMGINGGKNITPGYGGAKIFKSLDALKKWENARAAKVGETPLTELQLLRVLDEQLGFKGKPKTFESVVVDWLQEPKSTQTYLKLGYLKPPDSLVPGKPVSVVTPVKPVVAQVADPVQDVLDSGDKLDSYAVWKTIGKYKDGETIAYIKAPSGDVYRIDRFDANSVAVFRRNVGETKFEAWSPTGSGDNLVLSSNQLAANFYNVEWSANPAKATLGGKTLIPGKGPGDVVTFQQLWDTRWSWKNGDVLAETTSPVNGSYRRLVSDGKGGVKYQVRNFTSDPWNDLYDFASAADGQKLDVFQMTLTGDVLSKRTVAVSTMDQFSEGDAVTVIDIWAANVHAPNDTVLAYFYDPDYASLWRARMVNGHIELEFRPTGANHWKFAQSVYAPDDLKNVSTFPWHAAKHDGGIPDEVKVAVPGQTTVPTTTVPPPSPTPTGTSTIIQNMNEGDSIFYSDVWESLMETSWKDNQTKSVNVAFGKDYVLDRNYRLRFVPYNGLQLERETKTGGQWIVESVFPDMDSYFNSEVVGTLHWYLPMNDGSIPDALAAVAKPKMSPWPGKQVGDGILNSDIDMLSASDWNDYDVIATAMSHTGGVEYRIYKIGDTFVWESRGVGDPKWNVTAVFTKDPQKTLPGFTKWITSGDKVDPTSDSVKVALAQAKALKAAQAAPPPTPTKLKPGQTHIPGKSVGDQADSNEILANYSKYVDGSIIGYRTEKGYSYYSKSTTYRLIVQDGKLIQQKTNAKGVWGSTEIISPKGYGIYGKWDLVDEKATPQHVKNIQNFIDKKLGKGKYAPKQLLTPKQGPGLPVGGIQAPGTNFGSLQHVDISAWNDSEKDEIYLFFKGKGLYTSSNEEAIWAGVQEVKSHFINKYKGKYLNLTEVEILRILDERSALKHGKTDAHLFETKIVKWVNTPGGRSFVSKRIDAPIAATHVKVPMSAIDTSGIDPDKQTYRVFSVDEARVARDESWAKYGEPNKTQKAAQRSYTGSSSGSWNAAIRNGSTSYENQINSAQNGMRPSTRPMLLHRGTSFLELNDPNINSYQTLLPYVGRTYINRGFNSTSVGGHAAFSGNLLIEFECPIGTPMSFVRDFSQHSSENEMTLATHLVYKILSVTQDPNGYRTIMRVRVLGPATP